MATGDWSFPRAGCSCIRFKTQVANRSWVGWKGIGSSVRKLHFLKYEWSYGAPFSWNGSAEISTDVATYGNTSSNILGSQPAFSFGPITSDYGFIANYIGAPGTYVFTGGRQSAFGDPSNLSYPTNTFTRDSFTPGQSFSITLRETCWIRQNRFDAGQALVVTQKWSNEFLPGKMEEILRGDLENQRAYDATDMDNRNYFKSQNHVTNYNPRGGMREYEDDDRAIEPYVSPNAGFTVYGHAAMWVAKDNSFAVSPSTGKMIDAPFIAQCKIYQPGQHSIRSKTLIDTDGSIVVPCQSFPVECPAISQDELFLIPPPEKDRELKQIFWNRSDCTLANGGSV